LNVTGRPTDGGFDLAYFHVHTCAANNESYKNGRGNMKSKSTNYTHHQLAQTIVHAFAGKDNEAINSDAVNDLLADTIVPKKHKKVETKNQRIGGLKRITQEVSAGVCSEGGHSLCCK
jgi:hypothetical protein